MKTRNITQEKADYLKSAGLVAFANRYPDLVPYPLYRHDHIEFNSDSIELIERGITYGNILIDNSIRLVIQ